MEPMQNISKESELPQVGQPQVYKRIVKLDLPDGRVQTLNISLKIANSNKKRVEAICKQVIAHAKQSGMFGKGSKLNSFLRANELKAVETYVGEEFKYELGPAQKKTKTASRGILIGSQRTAKKSGSPERIQVEPKKATKTPESSKTDEHSSKQKSELIAGAKRFLVHCKKSLENHVDFNKINEDFERITSSKWFTTAVKYDQEQKSEAKLGSLLKEVGKKFESTKTQA